MSVRSNMYLTLCGILTLSACSGDTDATLSQTDTLPQTATATSAPAAATSTASETIKVTVGTMVFDVVTAGPKTGTPVILLHGFPENASEWKSQISALATAGYRVIAPNQRGYSDGARPESVDAYAVPELVRDVLGIATALGAERFHLVGHDWGAAVAWATASAAPARLLTLNTISVPHSDAFAKVLGDPSSCQPKASSYFSLFTSADAEKTLRANDSAYLRAVYAGLPTETIDGYVKYFSGAALTGGLNWYRANVAAGTVKGAKIGQITVPTMYIWSDGDTALCRDGAVLTKDYVSAPYRFEVISGVSHWVPEIAADRVSALLLEHLADPKKGT